MATCTMITGTSIGCCTCWHSCWYMLRICYNNRVYYNLHLDSHTHINVNAAFVQYFTDQLNKCWTALCIFHIHLGIRDLISCARSSPEFIQLPC